MSTPDVFDDVFKSIATGKRPSPLARRGKPKPAAIAQPKESLTDKFATWLGAMSDRQRSKTIAAFNAAVEQVENGPEENEGGEEENESGGGESS